MPETAEPVPEPRHDRAYIEFRGRVFAGRLAVSETAGPVAQPVVQHDPYALKQLLDQLQQGQPADALNMLAASVQQQLATQQSQTITTARMFLRNYVPTIIP